MPTTNGDADPELLASEQRVLQAYARGGSAEQVAAELGVSAGEARAHLQAVMRRLGTCSKLQTVLVAVRQGLISLS
jgi:DNA-binding NarL/FixJ family response regulator